MKFKNRDLFGQFVVSFNKLSGIKELNPKTKLRLLEIRRTLSPYAEDLAKVREEDQEGSRTNEM